MKYEIGINDAGKKMKNEKKGVGSKFTDKYYTNNECL